MSENKIKIEENVIILRYDIYHIKYAKYKNGPSKKWILRKKKKTGLETSKKLLVHIFIEFF